MITTYREKRYTKNGPEYQWVVRWKDKCCVCGQEHGLEEACGWGNPKPSVKTRNMLVERMLERVHLHAAHFGRKLIDRDCLHKCAKTFRRIRKTERLQDMFTKEAGQ